MSGCHFSALARYARFTSSSVDSTSPRGRPRPPPPSSSWLPGCVPTLLPQLAAVPVDVRCVVMGCPGRSERSSNRRVSRSTAWWVRMAIASRSTHHTAGALCSLALVTWRRAARPSPRPADAASSVLVCGCVGVMGAGASGQSASEFQLEGSAPPTTRPKVRCVRSSFLGLMHSDEIDHRLACVLV